VLLAQIYIYLKKIEILLKKRKWEHRDRENGSGYMIQHKLSEFTTITI
jgi:hypothetical protein